MYMYLNYIMLFLYLPSLGSSPSDCFIEVCVSGLFDCSSFITRVALHFILWSTIVSTCISGPVSS